MKTKEFNRRARRALADTKSQRDTPERKVLSARFSALPRLAFAPTVEEESTLLTVERWAARNNAKDQEHFDRCLAREGELAERENREPRPLLVWMDDSRVVD